MAYINDANNTDRTHIALSWNHICVSNEKYDVLMNIRYYYPSFHTAGRCQCIYCLYPARLYEYVAL
jgi:hypothetical protein